MKYVIDDEIVKNSGYTISEFFILLIIANDDNVTQSLKSVMSKEKGLSVVNAKHVLSDKLIQKINDILLNSDNDAYKRVTWYDTLAGKMRELYPMGKKNGYSWKGSNIEISRRLRTLREKYKMSFTEEQAIEATKAYISSFNGNYTYMKLLKYFIYKIVVDADGNTELRSDFLDFIENKDESTFNNNWTSELK